MAGRPVACITAWAFDAGVLLKGGARLLRAPQSTPTSAWERTSTPIWERMAFISTSFFWIIAGQNHFHASPSFQHGSLDGLDLPDALGAQVHQLPLLRRW